MTQVKESKYTCGEISGTLWDVGSDKICIIVHGFASNSRGRLQMNYGKILCKKGYNVIRLDLYSKEYNTLNTSMSLHIQQVNKISQKLHKSYKKIIYIGHSLGCAIGVLTNTYDGIILRDPSVMSVNSFNKSLIPLQFEEDKGFIVNRSVSYCISKEYADSINALDDEYFSGSDCGVCIICIEYPGYYDFWKSKETNKIVIHKIEGASHSFQERGVEEQLFELSNQFIDSLSSSL